MTIAINGYKFLRKVFDRFGLNLVVTGKGSVGGIDYETVQPTATYAPWINDKEFNATYKIVEPYTLVDKYRLWELWTLAKESKIIGGDILEVGTWKGGSSALIAKSAQLAGIKCNYYFCDTFTGCVKTSSKDSKYVGGEHADCTVKDVHKVLDKLSIKDYMLLTGIFPEDNGDLIKDKSFRLVHIDTDVYQSAKDVLYWVWDRMNPGGIVVFDDYGFHGCDGVTRLVDEEKGKSDRITIHNLNGHAIMIKVGNCENCTRY